MLFIALDFPAFDRPAKATSGMSSRGQSRKWSALLRKTASMGAVLTVTESRCGNVGEQFTKYRPCVPLRGRQAHGGTRAARLAVAIIDSLLMPVSFLVPFAHI